MRVQKLSLLFLIFQITNFSNAMESSGKKKHIVVEPVFFVEHEPKEVTKHLSWTSLAYIARHTLGSAFNGSSLNMLPEFFDVLRTIDATIPPQEIVWENQQAPNLLYEFLTAQRKPQEILDQVDNALKEKKKPQLMRDFAKLTFNPEVNAKIMKTITGAATLLQDLKEHGHTLHLVGNWNDEAAAKLQERFPSEFGLFDETMLSGKIKEAQGPRMYKRFFDEYEISPQETVFVHTSPIGVQHLADLDGPPHSIVCEKKDFTSTRKQLIEYGAFTN